MADINISDFYINNLPISSKTQAGIVQIGNNISVTEVGMISANFKKLIISLNGSNVTNEDYSVTYDNTNKKITIVHNLSSRLLGTIFDENNKQAFIGIDYVDENTISLQFNDYIFPSENSVWTVLLYWLS